MFKKKIKELEKQNLSLQEQLKAVSICPSKLLEDIDTLIQEESFDTIKYLIKILTNYLTLKEAAHCLILTDVHSIDKNDSLLDLIITLLIDSDINDYNKKCSLNYSINDLNLITNTWNENRIITNISDINKNNILYPNPNIDNYFIYPLDIVICAGGNHSQFAAKLKQEGETHITNILNVSNLYSKITFDGEKFIDSNNKIIKICVNEGEKIIGILYEIGRLLQREQNVIEKYFDKKIICKI